MKQALIWTGAILGLVVILVFGWVFLIKERPVTHERCMLGLHGKIPPHMMTKSSYGCLCHKREHEQFREPFRPDDNEGFTPSPPPYCQKRMSPRTMGTTDDYPCQKKGHKKFQRPFGTDDNKNFMPPVPDSRREKMHGCIMKKSNECHPQKDRQGRLKKSSGHCPKDNCPMESQNRNNCERCRHQEERQEQPFRHSEDNFPKEKAK